MDVCTIKDNLETRVLNKGCIIFNTQVLTIIIL